MKMYRFLFLVLLSFSIAFITINTKASDNQEIAKEKKGISFFKGSWKEALAKSKKENKPVFVDIYATWCGPCKMMSRLVFTQKDVGEFYNENFINVKVDAEKGEGRAIARKYNVRAYPTLLYVDGDGQIQKFTEGARGGDKLIKLGQQVLQKHHSD